MMRITNEAVGKDSAKGPRRRSIQSIATDDTLDTNEFRHIHVT